MSNELKNLITFYPEDIELLAKELAKNDNEEYYQIQIKIKTEEENKAKEEKMKSIVQHSPLRAMLFLFMQATNDAMFDLEESRKEEKNRYTKKKIYTNYFLSKDIFLIWKMLASMVEIRMNTTRKTDSGEFKICVTNCFKNILVFHGPKFKEYVNSLQASYFLSSTDTSNTLACRFNHCIIALLQDLLNDLKDNNRSFELRNSVNTTKPEDLFSGQNDIKYFFRINKNDTFSPIENFDNLDKLLHDTNNDRIDNLTPRELYFLEGKLRFLLQ